MQNLAFIMLEADLQSFDKKWRKICEASFNE
jgi:hypothetical protein